MAEMTPRACVLAALGRKEPDRVPFEFSYGFTPAIQKLFEQKTGAKDAAEYWDFPVRSVIHMPEPEETLWKRYASYYDNMQKAPEGWGMTPFGPATKPGSLEHFLYFLHPLENAATEGEIASYPMPDPNDPGAYGHLKESVKALHARNLAAQGELYCTLFETAWLIRGMEPLLTDFLINPGMAEILLDRLTDIRVVQARQLAEADVDVLRLGDDIAKQNGMMMSLDTYRTWLKPRLARIIKAAKEVKPDIHVFYHSDGDVSDAVPDLIEAGITILNPVQPECMDPVSIKAEFGDRLAFWGAIGTQTTMPFGTPEEVRATIKERIETVGKGGGLVVAPTHVLEPEVPWENIVAFVEAVRDYGGYR